MEIHVADVTAAFVIGIAGADLDVGIGAEEVDLALDRVVGQAQVHIGGVYRCCRK